MPEITAVLIDIDGVLTVSWRPLPGAVEAVTWLREQGLAMKLLTNTTSRTRATIAVTLAEAGGPGVQLRRAEPGLRAPDGRCPAGRPAPQPVLAD